VTGAARGMGRGIALSLAREGAAVQAADINGTAVQATAAAIRSEGGQAEAIEADITRRTDIDNMIKQTLSRFGGIDVLVNNAGIIGYMSAVELTEAEWDRVLDVNLKGAFFCAQQVGVAMVAARRGGVIINVTSISAELPEPDCLHYGVSKAGLAHLTGSLAVALGPHGIRVVAIAPGTIHTPMNDELLREPEFVRQRRASIALRRIGAVEEIADATVFLASDDARYVTGSTLYVEGGTMLLR
jgi:glucose 1-dehydrogenase